MCNSERINFIIIQLASGAAIATAVHTLSISIPGTAAVSFADVLSIIKHSDASAVNPRKRILVLNIITVVIGIVMWIIIILSLILKWKHSKVFAIIVSVSLNNKVKKGYHS